jgi:hypothetical protein
LVHGHCGFRLVFRPNNLYDFDAAGCLLHLKRPEPPVDRSPPRGFILVEAADDPHSALFYNNAFIYRSSGSGKRAAYMEVQVKTGPAGLRRCGLVRPPQLSL